MIDPFLTIIVVLTIVSLVVNICFAWFFWRLIRLFLRKVEPMGFGSFPIQRQPTEDLLRG